MLRAATPFAASLTDASGGPGSRLSPSAWHLKTALKLEVQVARSAQIASVGRKCEYIKLAFLNIMKYYVV